MPSAEERVAWLREVGATEIVQAERPIGDGSIWAWSRHSGVPLETGWQTIAEEEKLLSRILAGKVTAHHRLEAANAVLHAVSLRSKGLLFKWQQQLAHYPDVLQQRLIAKAVEPWLWKFAYTYWDLARRGDRLPLAGRLVEDVERVLRILFTLNRRWEPSWKRIEFETHDLAIKPNRLTEHIDKIFSTGSSEDSVELCLQLVIDTLELIPPAHDASYALASVREGLRARAR